MSDHCAILEQIFEHVGDGVLFCDTQGIIQIWTKGMESIFGYSANEAIGKSLDIIIPEKYRKIHWDGFYVAVKTKNTKYSSQLLSVPAIGKNNKSLSIEFSISIVQEDNNIIGFGAVIRDATKQFLEKKQMKKELEDLKNQLNKQK